MSPAGVGQKEAQQFLGLHPVFGIVGLHQGDRPPEDRTVVPPDALDVVVGC